MPTRLVYTFGAGKADGRGDQKELLGGKGANLAEMSRIGLPVPPGFTITTEVCVYYYKNGRRYPPALKGEVEKALRKVERTVGRKFGDKNDPLLVSVRSGARASMPGMMDTILNLGLNDETVEGLAEASGKARFAWDAYRRFVQMYGDVVMGVRPRTEEEHEPFDELLARKKKRRGVEADTGLTADDLKELVEEFKGLIRDRTGESFPQDPEAQLWGAIGAVFGSWMNERAVRYRRMEKIPDDWGTAVNVQAMVFGNLGEDSGTGVAFTRDPSTGRKVFYGEYLVNAQGEDVVAGIRTPQPLTKAQAKEGEVSLEEAFPSAYSQLVKVREKLERHYRDMQDIEFTIERGRLWMLQTRNGKRTAQAAVKIAVDLVKEKRIDRETAICRVAPSALDQLLHPTFDPKAPRQVIAKGLPASPGAAVGRAVFAASRAEAMAAEGEKVILVRIETSPEDIGGMDAAQGILTSRGGMTSHAAVVARGMGKTCVAGAGEVAIDYEKRSLTARGVVIREGDWLSLDGSTGEVMAGRVPVVEAELSGDFRTLMSWADKVRRLKVRANADTPADAERARAFGAEGIGLCRTEHMFFEGDRIDAVREMILAEDEAGRRKALAELLPMQRKDFEEIFAAMEGLPVTIRLLDPPLHEFTPNDEESQRALAGKLQIPFEKVRRRVESLHEFNPMLGHRGCRLGITYPEIYEMQVRAILEAAVSIADRGKRVLPEIMHPLVGTKEEFAFAKELTDRVAKEVFAQSRRRVPYLVGTMIEVPRAAVTAAEIVEAGAEFFSFGTNDLTQMTFGYSRDDAGAFIGVYLDKKILPADPFQTIDQAGVGRLVTICAREGRAGKRDLKLGICGEHGGDPESVKFCHRVGLDYVSCSPFRVPIARLAAAQAAVEEKAAKKKRRR